jgi:hypothetical protein
MNHLSEEQLIELYYSKNLPEATGHLDACAECAGNYEAIEADLADLKPIEPPVRDESYGQQVWDSIAHRLPVFAKQKRPWFRQPLWIGLSAASACALMVAGAFYAGRLWEHRKPPQAAATVTPAPQPPRRVVVVVLSDHLDRSERLLVQLKHADASDDELAQPLREEARSLLAANAKCRQQAELAGDPDLTKALDRLNDVLTQLANHPGGLDAEAITKLQDEMDTDGLLFEVRVLRSRIPDRQAALHHHRTGGIA